MLEAEKDVSTALWVLSLSDLSAIKYASEN